MRRVAIPVTRRAEGSPLEPVIAAIEAHPDLEHNDIEPDIVVLFGDTFEMMVTAAHHVKNGTICAHVHGGELSYGSDDQRYRYAITALSSLHFAATEASAGRLRQLGIPPNRVILCGAPGLDRLRDYEPSSRDTLNELCAGVTADPFILCTVHPSREDPAELIAAVLGGIEAASMPVVFTTPNGEPGSDEIMGSLIGFVETVGVPAILVRDCGTQTYFDLMHYAAVMVGNSSSGIIEAPSFGLPVVNVGERQAGREAAEQVLHTSATPTAIADAIGMQLLRRGCWTPNPYAPHGIGRASQVIADTLATVELDELRTQRFVDWPEP